MSFIRNCQKGAPALLNWSKSHYGDMNSRMHSGHSQNDRSLSIYKNIGLPVFAYKIYDQQKRSFHHRCISGNLAVLNGNGRLARSVITRLLQNNTKVVLCGSDPKGVYNQAQSASQGQFQFVPIGHEAGNISESYARLFETIASDPSVTSVLAFHSRGLGYPPKGKTYRQVLIDPATAFAKSYEQTIPNAGKKCALVSVSSSVASIPGFDHPYATARNDADSAVLDIVKEGNVTILRPDYVLHSLSNNDETIFENHPWSLEELALFSLGQFVFGNQDTLAIQPMVEEQFVDVVTSPQIFQTRGIIDCVGPKAYTIEEIYEIARRSLGYSSPKFIRLDAQVVSSLIQHIPYGHMAPFAAELILHRQNCPEANKPFDHQPVQELIGDELADYETHLARQIKEGEVVIPNDSYKKHAQIALKAFWESREARKAFISFLRHFPYMQFLDAHTSTLMKGK